MARFPNLDFFAGLRTARECLLELSVAGYTTTRVRIQPEGVVVEIASPMVGLDPVTERGDFHQVRYRDCDVVWRKLTKSNEVSDE